MYFQTRLLHGNPNITALSKLKPEYYPYALISTSLSTGKTGNSRFSILFAYPQNKLTLDHNFVLVNDTGLSLNNSNKFLDALGQWFHALEVGREETTIDTGLPFTGGWFIYLSYELAAEIEPCLSLPKNRSSVPVAQAIRCPAAIVVDHDKNTCTAIAENEYAYLLDEIAKDFSDISLASNTSNPGGTEGISITEVYESDPDTYLDKINIIKKYIKDGDIFQANLSRPWRITLGNLHNKPDDVELFEALSKSNPGSFSALVKLDQATVISSSPERLVRSINNTVETRPIAGTRPRSDNNLIDEDLAKELLEHPKERAEHIMLIDLERNDLGRICIPGTINVNELMVVESYKHVHHIVSNIKGTLRRHITPAEVIKAVFPGGTITGCPKVRCMEILAEMEMEPRGAYTGSVGYINRNGNMDLNILIRTLVREGNTINFRAGGGIVADSIPLSELNETRAKAKGLLKIFKVESETCHV